MASQYAETEMLLKTERCGLELFWCCVISRNYETGLYEAIAERKVQRSFEIDQTVHDMPPAYVAHACREHVEWLLRREIELRAEQIADRHISTAKTWPRLRPITL